MRKEACRTALIALSALFLLSSCLSAPSSTDFDGSSYDVSYNQDGSLIAKMTRNGNFYSVSLEGTGRSKDFTEGERSPWHGLSSKINSLSVASGVTSIGEYFFESIALDHIVLPSSVTSIGVNSFSESTIIYSLGEALESSANNPIYYYSESEPSVGGRFWHYVDGTPCVWVVIDKITEAKVLFIGNSFTYYEPSSNDVPSNFAKIAANLGLTADVATVNHGSYHLYQFADSADEMGAKVDEALASSSEFDYAIIQEHSTYPITAYDTFEAGAKALKAKIDASQKNCKTRLYETWGYPNQSSYGTVSEMEASLRAAYEKCASAIGADGVDYIGKAFTYVYENHAEDVSLYYTADSKHPNEYGSYLSALMHVGYVYGADIRECTYCPEGLDASVLEILNEVAYACIYE